MNTSKLQKLLNGLWTAQDVCEKWGVTAMTVHLWREDGLPALVIPGHSRAAVRFLPDDVRHWTKNKGKKQRRYRPAA